ncbi:MAG: hypothetical protein R2799_03610 [Crocinitomicaceae bacterium]
MIKVARIFGTKSEKIDVHKYWTSTDLYFEATKNLYIMKKLTKKQLKVLKGGDTGTNPLSHQGLGRTRI